MRIVFCNGGLGNQTFQYIFSRFVELETREPCFLDDSFFGGEPAVHNGFEINKVFPNAKPRLLSEYFTEDVWNYILQERRAGKSVCQQMENMGEHFMMIAETSDYQFTGNVLKLPPNEYYPWIAQTRGNIYYHGYWIHENWLKNKYKETLTKELMFLPIEDDKNKEYENLIRMTESVALHVRRGDFVKLHWDVPAEQYRTAVMAMKEKVALPHFFVFSDDIAWCKNNQNQMGLTEGDVTYVEGNQNGKNYIDMQLMSNCKNVIMVHSSSFSYLAALLNKSNGVVYNATGRVI